LWFFTYHDADILQIGSRNNIEIRTLRIIKQANKEGPLLTMLAAHLLISKTSKDVFAG